MPGLWWYGCFSEALSARLSAFYGYGRGIAYPAYCYRSEITFLFFHAATSSLTAYPLRRSSSAPNVSHAFFISLRGKLRLYIRAMLGFFISDCCLWFRQNSIIYPGIPSCPISVADVLRKSCGVHCPLGKTSASFNVLVRDLLPPSGFCRSLITLDIFLWQIGLSFLPPSAGKHHLEPPVISLSDTKCARA